MNGGRGAGKEGKVGEGRKIYEGEWDWLVKREKNKDYQNQECKSETEDLTINPTEINNKGKIGICLCQQDGQLIWVKFLDK